ncbi:MAG TPA: nucleotidyltransferase substrate binding protein [Ruminiclostridium sp.]
MSDYKQKYENYKNAFDRLSKGIVKFDKINDLQRDGLIQRFEFTFELAWKTIKAIFEDEGLIGLNSPKTILREALSAGLIEDDELWLLMLNDRNSTSHIYSEELAIEICNNITTKHITAFGELIKQIQIRKFD